MKCKECGCILLDGKCLECDIVYFTPQEGRIKNDVYTGEACPICGKTGRRVGEPKKTIVRCFDCYHQDRVNYYSESKKTSLIDAKIANIITEDMLRPMFYGGKPSYDRYEKLV